MPQINLKVDPKGIQRYSDWTHDPDGYALQAIGYDLIGRDDGNIQLLE